MDFVQIWIGTEASLEPYHEHIDTVKALVGAHDHYEMIRLEPRDDQTAYDQSNLLRVELATQNPNMCYVDVDCKLFSVPDMQPDAPYAAPHAHHVSGYLFFVNGHTAPFERIRARQLEVLNHDKRRGRYGRLGIWQHAQHEVFHKIPKVCFAHDYATLSKLRRQKK